MRHDTDNTAGPVARTGTERHPLMPFLPGNARLLMLGSFPPKKERWSMDFFYPNFNNDMWRIIGMVFFGDRRYFETCCGEATDGKPKKFDRERITGFCSGKGIALYDAACEVRRLRDNASDKFLEIVTPTDIGALLASIPECNTIAATGEKAAEAVSAYFGCGQPATRRPRQRLRRGTIPSGRTAPLRPNRPSASPSQPRHAARPDVPRRLRPPRHAASRGRSPHGARFPTP